MLLMFVKYVFKIYILINVFVCYKKFRYFSVLGISNGILFSILIEEQIFYLYACTRKSLTSYCGLAKISTLNDSNVCRNMVLFRLHACGNKQL